MSNFQRSRSKVWWGDSPPNIGSPVAHASNRRDEEWEPQLPRWAPQQEPIEEAEESPQAPNNGWIRRQNSPGSHKSQDSGFSDSDSSPCMQQNAENGSKSDKKEDDEEDCQATAAATPKKDVSASVANYLQTPKSISKYLSTPARSLIKTPKDVKDYLQACCEVGHSIDHIENHDRQYAKDAKKSLFKEFESCIENDVDAAYSKNDSNIEYIQLSPSQQIAVNNQPRVRSPITRISYHTPVHFYTKNDSFQRNALNRSLNYTAQRLDEQILDDGPHSLSYVESTQRTADYASKEVAIKSLTSRKITDSLNLKTPKKSTSRNKQKIQTKGSKTRHVQKMNKGFFNFLPKRNDSIKTIYDITKNSIDASRVPTLGLNHPETDWVFVQSEAASQTYSERFIDENRNMKITPKSPKGILKSPGIRKITPPLQFQDGDIRNAELKKNTSVENGSLKDNNLIDIDELDFDESTLGLPCTSTPKGTSLTPYETSGKIRPVNLLTNFNESVTKKKNAKNDIELTPLEIISRNQPAPLKHWLCEQIGSYEPECMTTLQSKSLGVELNAKVANSSITITGNIRKVQTYGQIIVHQYKQIATDIENTSTCSIRDNTGEIKSMVANINEFVLAHSITLKIKPPGETPERWDKIKISLQNNIQKVSEITEDIVVELNESMPELNVLQKHLHSILEIFIETARAVLVQQMRTLVSMLEEPPSDMILKSTLTSLGHLGVMDNPEDLIIDSKANYIKIFTVLPFIECGVPRALLSVIIESSKSSIKALSLRALATICVTSEAVEQFEEAGGIEIISDILNEPSNPEPQMREAITVLTQITAPWLQGDYKIESLFNYLDIIIKNITRILSKTLCCQLLLLCTASLVNLTTVAKKRERQRISSKDEELKFCDIIEILSRHATIQTLLEAVKNRGPNTSVFLQEQTAAMINIISTSSKGQILLSGFPATAVALICFLRTPCATPTRTAHIQAEFRLINLAAEALARLCTLPEVTAQVIQLEGVTRLVRVIQAQKAQKTNGKCSDQILVNCLRALRSIAKNHDGCLEYIGCDVTDMIQPPLMESVKLYSAKQESYV